jgi:hypothetical protein
MLSLTKAGHRYFSLEAQLEELRRELEMRHRVYPSLIARRKMRNGEADYKIAAMKAVIATFEQLIAERGRRGVDTAG